MNINEEKEIIFKKIGGKEIAVEYAKKLKEMSQVVYQVNYKNTQGKTVQRNIGISRDKDNGLKRPMRHITDNADKSAKWLLKNIDKVATVTIEILQVIGETFEEDKQLKVELEKLEGFYNYKSHAVDKIPTLNQFLYNEDHYCGNGYLINFE